MTTAQDGGKVVSFTHWLPSPPGNAPGTHFCYRLSWPQGHSAIGRVLCQWKIPMTPAGIETATFWFVVQHLNHCATAVPQNLVLYINKKNHVYFLSMAVQWLTQQAPLCTTKLFCQTVTSRGLWLPSSPYLNLNKCFLWDIILNTDCSNNSHTQDDLQEGI